jgi:hypothetical protein
VAKFDPITGAKWGESVRLKAARGNWLPTRVVQAYLIAIVDEATGRTFAQFREANSMAENLDVLLAYVKQFGRPITVHTDRANLFQDRQGQNPIRRVLRELDIHWIGEPNPEPRGFPQQFLDHAQKTLVKELHTARATTLDAANRYLQEVYLPAWNQAKNAVDVHRPVPEEYSSTSPQREVDSRTVRRDFTVRFRRTLYRIPDSHQSLNLVGTVQAILSTGEEDPPHMQIEGQTVELERWDAPDASEQIPRLARPKKSKKVMNTPWRLGVFRLKAPPLWHSFR